MLQRIAVNMKPAQSYLVSLKHLGIVTVLSYVIKFIRVPIIARILSPEDFGILGLALVLLGALQNITAMGAQKVIVQRKEIDNIFLGSCWSFMMIRGGLITVIVLLLSPLYRQFLENPDSIAVLQLIAFAPLVNSFISPNVFIQEREGNFTKIALFEALVEFLSLFLILGLAFVLRDVWALAWGMLLVECLRVLISFVIFKLPCRPNFKHLSHFRELISVGKFYLIIAIGTYITIQIDNLFVGKLFGAKLLGYYIVAHTLIKLPNQIVLKVLNRIALPQFSRVQDSVENLTLFYQSITSNQIFFVWVIFGFCRKYSARANKSHFVLPFTPLGHRTTLRETDRLP